MVTAADRAAAAERGRGRGAEAPTAIPTPGWKDIGWRVFESFNRNRAMFSAAGVTFHLLLALVPTLSAFVSIYGLFVDQRTVLDHVGLLAGIVPAGGLEIIEEQLQRIAAEGTTALSWGLLLSLAIAIWSASAGVKAMFEAMNIAYGEEEARNFFVVNALALVFTLGIAVAGLLVIGAVVVIPILLSVLPLGGAAEWLIRIGGYAVLAFTLLLGLGAFYRWGPSRANAKWRWISPGAALALVLILVLSVAFSWYVANFGNYSATYGSLGALIGMLTWMWLSTTLVIVGGSVNAEIEHQTAKDSTVGPDMPLGERGAQMADTVGKKHGDD